MTDEETEQVDLLAALQASIDRHREQFRAALEGDQQLTVHHPYAALRLPGRRGAPLSPAMGDRRGMGGGDRPMILGIDPGPTESGWAMLDLDGVHRSGVDTNEIVLNLLGQWTLKDKGPVAIEMIASYGMPVGADVFRTCVWIGRFQQIHGGQARLIPRLDVKMHLCHDSRAKDTNIRQALIDLLGPPGVKAAPGPTYGVKSHAWAALAVAVTARDTKEI